MTNPVLKENIKLCMSSLSASVPMNVLEHFLCIKFEHNQNIHTFHVTEAASSHMIDLEWFV